MNISLRQMFYPNWAKVEDAPDPIKYSSRFVYVQLGV